MKKFLVLSILGAAVIASPAFAQHGGHGGGGHGGGFHGGGGGYHGGGFHGGGGYRGGYHGGGFRGGWGGYRGYYRGPAFGFGFGWGGYYAPYYDYGYAPYYAPYYYGAPYGYYPDDYYYDAPPPPPPPGYDAPPPGNWHVTQGQGETDYELPDSVLFGLDSARLSASADQVLHQIADAAEQHPDAQLVVEGYTDTSGSHAHNMQLSRARADAVADALVRQGITRDRIRTEGLGETRLAVQTGNGVREPRNRRVVVRLLDGGR